MGQLLVSKPKSHLSGSLSWLKDGPDVSVAPGLSSLVEDDNPRLPHAGEYWQQRHVIGYLHARRAVSNLNGTDESNDAKETELDFIGRRGRTVLSTVKLAHMQGVLPPHIRYTLLGCYSRSSDLRKKWWIAIEMVGKRKVGDSLALERTKWAELSAKGEEAQRTQNAAAVNIVT